MAAPGLRTRKEAESDKFVMMAVHKPRELHRGCCRDPHPWVIPGPSICVIVVDATTDLDEEPSIPLRSFLIS